VAAGVVLTAKKIYLGLGSNIGDRESNLKSAIEKLHTPDLRITRISPVYETAALDYTAQDDFLNCVVEAETNLMPMRLLSRIQSIEREMGRKRLIPKGPRNIDIDILLHGRSVVNASRLQIPHPRMDARPFVLEPLAQLDPNLRHPVHKKTIREMLAAAPHQRLVRLGLRLDIPFLGDGGQE
jgi:2-amino-4-hydroxy-6-hydroxymethyldihydropteridine diphosphokinase